MNARMRRQRGFSLVELMVASAVGLVVALAVTTAIVSTARQSTILGGNAAAQSNAQIGLSLIDLAGRSAGAGFYNNGQALCPTWNAYNGSTVIANNAPWMPVRIVSGGSSGSSDTIIFTGGGGSRPLSAAPLMDVTTGAIIVVSNASDFAAGDLAVLGAAGEGDPCTLIQVSVAPSTPASCGGNATVCQLLVRNPNAGLNPGPGVFTTRPTYGFDNSGGAAAPAVVSRVGTAASGFRQDAFTVQCNALVRYNAFTTTALPGCTGSPLSFGAGVDAMATDVVLLHAQYGVSNAASSDVVTQWVEASGTTWGGTPAQPDIGRIKAIRLVLVARSREADSSQVSGPCTNTAGVANTGPCSFEDAAAPVIDVSNVPVPAGRSWRNYRYRAHTSVIPLRSVIWSDS